MADDYGNYDGGYGYGGQDNSAFPGYTGQINVQNPAPWNGGYDQAGYDNYGGGYGNGYQTLSGGQDYSGNVSRGNGGYQIGDSWSPVSSPQPQWEYTPQGYQQVNPDAYRPASYDNSPGRTGGTPSYAYDANWFNGPSMASQGGGSAGGGGGQRPFGGGGGAGGYQQPPYQRVNPGAPSTDLYNRYSNLLQNPQGMAQDPAYKFLFNQGEQALNRSLAARRLTYSGKALNDTMAYGQGMAFDYMNKMLPQYGAGAASELSRYMGPTGLYMQGAAMNNNVTNMEGSNRAAQELMPYYQNMMGGGGSPGYSQPNIGYGGASSSYNPVSQQPTYQPRLQQSYTPQDSANADSIYYNFWNDQIGEVP